MRALIFEAALEYWRGTLYKAHYHNPICSWRVVFWHVGLYSQISITKSPDLQLIILLNYFININTGITIAIEFTLEGLIFKKNHGIFNPLARTSVPNG